MEFNPTIDNNDNSVTQLKRPKMPPQSFTEYLNDNSKFKNHLSLNRKDEEAQENSSLKEKDGMFKKSMILENKTVIGSFKPGILRQSNSLSKNKKENSTKSHVNTYNSDTSNGPQKFLRTVKSALKQNLAVLTKNNNKRNSQEKRNDINYQQKVKSSELKINENLSNSILSTFKMTFQEKCFWSNEQITSFQQQIRHGCMLIKQKQMVDFDEIESYIETENMSALKEIITSVNFKRFYKKEMSKPNVLNKIFKAGMGELVNELLNLDPDFYNFDQMLIVNLFEEIILKNNCLILSSDSDHEDMIKLKSYLKDTIKYSLFTKITTYLLSYLIAMFGFYDEFRHLIKNEKECFEDDLEIFENFDHNSNIDDFASNQFVFNSVLGYCLKNEWESIAITLYKIKFLPLDNEIIKIAQTNKKVNFLKIVWEHHNKKIAYNLSQNKWQFSFTKEMSQAEILDKQIGLLPNIVELVSFKISDLIKNIKRPKGGEDRVVKSIIETWEYIEHDRELLDNLFQRRFYDEILSLINRKKYEFWTFKPEHLEEIIKNKECNLIAFFLEQPNLSKQVLNKIELQENIIVNYMKDGDKIYYGTEMLCRIYKANWHQDLTKDLCKSILKSIKTKDIMNCHSPILTCVMLSEFLKGIASISLLHYSRLEKVMKELLQFCENIQNSSTDELYIKFLMEQRSISGKTAFQISAENNFYSVLNNPNIGTIVGKMWNGEISYNSLFKASSLSRFLNNLKIKNSDPYQNFEPIDPNKSYFFQLKVWENSCLLRYLPESLFTLVLIVNYNLFLYTLSLDKAEKDKDPKWFKLSIYFLFFYAQVICININIIYQFAFSKFSDRKSKITYWNYVEMLLFFLSSILYIDFEALFDDKDLAQFILVTILCIIDIATWIRIAGILLTWKNLGPVIRMIYLMAKLLVKYIIIYSLFIVCMSAVYTAIFFGSTNQFIDFTTSLITLITPFVQKFSTKDFDHNELFGSIMIMIYTTLTGIMLINLLIAVLSNVYDELSKQVDASHRAILINYHEKIQWNTEYGYIIFLPNPLNICNILMFPIQAIKGTSNKQSQIALNKLICKIYFLLFYFPFIFVVFTIYTLLLLPFCYIKANFIMIQSYFSGYGYSNNKSHFLINIFKSLFLGLFIILYYNIRDIFHLCIYQFKEPEQAITNMERIKSFINKEDIQIFLDFIHLRSKTQDNSLNCIFIDYLEHVRMKKMENDNVLKEKTEYLEKLNMYSKSRNLNSSTLMIANHLSKEKQSSAIKKNLIIIEILENFLVENDTEEFLVDIDKLKMLLPKGLIINDEYIKRLIYTDISSINNAVNKLKSKKNKFLQYQLINKITNSALKIDKDIDYEIQKNITMRKTEKRDHAGVQIDKALSSMFKNMNELNIDFKNKLNDREKKLLRNTEEGGTKARNKYRQQKLETNTMMSTIFINN